MNIDTSIRKILKKNNIIIPKTTTFKTIQPTFKFNNNIKKYNNIYNVIPKISSIPGASLKMQNKWKAFSPTQKNILRSRLPDSDGDRIPDKYDCQPKNVMRQDFIRKSGVPIVDNIENSKYNRVEMNMTPDNYIKKAFLMHRQQTIARGKPWEYSTQEEYLQNSTSDSRVNEIKNKIQTGEMDAPWFELDDGEIVEQEGRHRAVAAKQLGLETIPVNLIYNKNDIKSEEQAKRLKLIYNK
jgi:hypothetical protein